MSPPGILGNSPPASFFQLTRTSVLHPRLKPRETRRRAGEGVEPQYKYIIMHLPSSCAQPPPGRNVTSVAFFLGKVNSATVHLSSSGAGFKQETTSEQPWRPPFRHRWPAAQPNALSSRLRCPHLEITVYMPRRWQYEQYFSMTADKCRIIP